MAEELQRKANDLLSAILNTTHVSTACMDVDGNFTLVNRTYAQAGGI